MKLRFIKDEMGADRQAALQKQKKGQRYCIRAIGAVCYRAFCLGRTLGSLERAERGMRRFVKDLHVEDHLLVVLN